jgi:hypothetical protein
MNCNSRVETQQASKGCECLPITELISPKVVNQKENDLDTSSRYSSSLETHTVDFEFSPTPTFAHFVRIDNGLYYQHVNPINSHFFQSNLELHENTAIMHLPSYSSWRKSWSEDWLALFSVTLWTCTRMYPAVVSTSTWYRLAIEFSKAFENETLKIYVIRANN